MRHLKFKSKHMSHIKHYLDSIWDSDHNWKKKLLYSWTQVVGKLNHKISLEKIQKNTLVIGVADASWLQELYLLAPTLIVHINKYLGGNFVHQLRFRQITHKKRYTNRQYHPIQTPSKPARPLNQQERTALDHIQDNELSNVLEAFLSRCLNNGEQ